MRRCLFHFVLVVTATIVSTAATGADYLRDIKPLLQHKCYSCHGALKQQAGLRADTAASLVKGGASGIAGSPGHPEKSLLIHVLTGDAGFRMPPDNEGAPLTADEISLIREWISAGSPIPEQEEPQSDPQTWWSYRPIERPPLPEVSETSWCRNEIDYFISAQRTQLGLPHTVVPQSRNGAPGSRYSLCSCLSGFMNRWSCRSADIRVRSEVPRYSRDCRPQHPDSSPSASKRSDPFRGLGTAGLSEICQIVTAG